MQVYLLIVTLFVALFPSSLLAEELNAGFVQGLWYAPEPIIANESTRMYVALRNNTDHDLTGTVQFTDNGTRVGVSYVSALPGRLVEAWVDWAPSYGEHTITASLTDVRIQTIGETPSVGVVENTIAEDTVFADYDTDGDGMLNELDTDDDNDTVSDADEKVHNTDPLKANPIEKVADTTEDTKSESSGGSNKATETLKPADNQELSYQSQKGLEQYVPNQKARAVVESVTNTINETKANLDTYREKRTDDIKEYFENTPTITSTDSTGTSTDSSATITRSQIDSKEGFLQSVIRAGKALGSGVYSLVLFTLSGALAHPAILELILLLIIILFIYRTARRLGRRRTS
jgi:hypothetical protein